jgi:hypothetical protein
MGKLVWFYPDGWRLTWHMAQPSGTVKQHIIDLLGDRRVGWYDDDGVLCEAYGKEPFALVQIYLPELARRKYGSPALE